MLTLVFGLFLYCLCLTGVITAACTYRTRLSIGAMMLVALPLLTTIALLSLVLFLVFLVTAVVVLPLLIVIMFISAWVRVIAMAYGLILPADVETLMVVSDGCPDRYLAATLKVPLSAVRWSIAEREAQYSKMGYAIDRAWRLALQDTLKELNS